jgi:hypothetical protein
MEYLVVCVLCWPFSWRPFRHFLSSYLADGSRGDSVGRDDLERASAPGREPGGVVV